MYLYLLEIQSQHCALFLEPGVSAFLNQCAQVEAHLTHVLRDHLAYVASVYLDNYGVALKRCPSQLLPHVRVSIRVVADNPHLLAVRDTQIRQI